MKIVLHGYQNKDALCRKKNEGTHRDCISFPHITAEEWRRRRNNHNILRIIAVLAVFPPKFLMNKNAISKCVSYFYIKYLKRTDRVEENENFLFRKEKA